MKTLPRQVIHRPFGHIPVHIVYRLEGSIPITVINDLKGQRAQLFQNAEREIAALPNELFVKMKQKFLDQIGEDIEGLLEDALHTKSNGPYFLSRPDLSKIVLDSWKWIAQTHNLYIYAICVMSNHVHIILRGSIDGEVMEAGPIMKTHKSFTATMCNRTLERTGQPFWSKHYFDREVREGTFTRVMWYVLNNPVKAGLVENWRDWPGTWLNPDFKELFG